MRQNLDAACRIRLPAARIPHQRTHDETAGARTVWTSYGFTHNQIILDEQLEISVPRDRTVKVKSMTVQPVLGEADGYRTYTWHRTSLQHKAARQAESDGTRLAAAGAGTARREGTTSRAIAQASGFLCNPASE
jgi:hypothetical protein